MSDLNTRLTAIVTESLRAGLTKEQLETAMERKIIEVALTESKGQATRAARLLGIHRNTLTNLRRVLIGPTTAMRRQAARRTKRKGRR